MALALFLRLEINRTVKKTAAGKAAASATRTEPKGSYREYEMRCIRERPVSAIYLGLGQTRYATALSHELGLRHLLRMQSAFYKMHLGTRG